MPRLVVITFVPHEVLLVAETNNGPPAPMVPSKKRSTISLLPADFQHHADDATWFKFCVSGACAQEHSG